eukprot:COSAG01_NODE_33639_length_561_cov_0.846320_1_plen_44_part_10
MLFQKLLVHLQPSLRSQLLQPRGSTPRVRQAFLELCSKILLYQP